MEESDSKECWWSPKSEISVGVSLKEGETPLKAQEPPMITSGTI